MKSSTFVLGLAAFALIIAPTFAQKKAVAKDGWYTDLNKALAAAKKQHKVVMVDFNATWCGPCQMYKHDVFPKAGFQKASKDMILVDIDVDQQPALAQKYGISGIPDLRFLSPAGKPIGRIIGFVGEEKLLSDMKKATAK